MKRSYLLIGFLSVLILVFGGSKYDQMLLERQLRPIAEKHMGEYRTSLLEAASLITVTRDLILVGEPHAKVEVFVRAAEGSGTDGVRGIEYLYAKHGDVWTLEESGSCTSEACVLRGREAFQQR